MTNEDSNLFKPLKVGKINLKHRVVLAPLTRFRAHDDHTHSKRAIEYYSQRACFPGTLLITEASFISLAAGGYDNVPGIFNDVQVKGWKKITDAVHARESFIYIQLWALGRAADPKVQEKNGYDVVSSSDIPMTPDSPKPRGLTKDEIKEYINNYRNAAKLAIQAGFDGVEVHGANGYLIDQFTQDTANNRTDEYGGSIENRARFALEAVRACVDEIGADRVGIRLSPFSVFQGMKMKDPIPQFSYLIKNLPQDLAYLHVVESRISGSADSTEDKVDSTKFAHDLWQGPFLTAGGYTTDSAIQAADENEGVAVVMGRYFISNPDLVAKMMLGIDFEPYDRDTFYSKGDEGYLTYKVNEELVSKASRL